MGSKINSKREDIWDKKTNIFRSNPHLFTFVVNYICIFKFKYFTVIVNLIVYRWTTSFIYYVYTICKVMVKIERISLEKDGLIKFFSPNEARILELLWENKKMTSPEIKQQCDDLSLSCVAGTLDRLIKSDFVNRSIDETSKRMKYVYTPVGNRQKVGTKICEKIIDCLADTFGTSTIDTIKKNRDRGKLK